MRLRLIGFAAILWCALAGCGSLPQSADSEVSAEEMAAFRRYLDGLKLRVFFREDSAEEPLLRDAALRAAVKYAAYSGVSLTQDADEAWVSMEIDAVTDGESRGDNHYGAARLRCTMYEPLTGVELCVLEGVAPRTFSKAGQFDAKASAVDSVLSRLVPEADRQARDYLVDLYQKGRTMEGRLFFEMVNNRILNPKE